MKEKNSLAYHYTSLDVFLKLMEGITSDLFMFHGSYVFSMNDSSEYIKGYNCIWKFLHQLESDLINRGTIINDEYKLTRVHEVDKTTRPVDWWKEYHISLIRDGFFAPFVISFSKQKDSIPQWCIYGDNGKGVALGFEVQVYRRIHKTSNNELLVDLTHERDNDWDALEVIYNGINFNSPIAKYMRMEYERYLDIIKGIPQNDVGEQLKAKLDAIEKIVCVPSSLIKHKSYEFEQEVRILLPKNDIKDVNYKMNSKEQLVPYIFIKIPIHKLKRIVVGPCADFNSVKLMIKTKLEQHGIKDVRITKSRVPYR
jgi:hypothetical protein